MTELQAQSSVLNEQLVLTRDKVRPLIDLEHALEGLDRLDDLEALLATFVAERQLLDTQSIDVLRAEVQRYQVEFEPAAKRSECL